MDQCSTMILSVLLVMFMLTNVKAVMVNAQEYASLNTFYAQTSERFEIISSPLSAQLLCFRLFFVFFFRLRCNALSSFSQRQQCAAFEHHRIAETVMAVRGPGSLRKRLCGLA